VFESGRGDKDVDTVAQQLKKESKNDSVGGRNVTP
jgi:tryptophan synthase beta subunit